MADGKVTISTALDNGGLRKGLKNITGAFGGMKSVLGKISATITTALSVKAILDFSKAAIELGSNLAEVQNVVDVSFGDMKKAAEDFADTAIMKFGMSELAAKKTASTYMAMAKGLGVAETEASDMAISLAGLSGDVASFCNLEQDVAAKKLQGVFTGESEALKELGVVMTQTNLKQFALAHGMNANVEAMTQAELVALRYAFVVDALSLAAGDFERTQNSWANQTRILSMQWQQFMGVIGQTLTTVLLPAVKLLNKLVGVLITAAQRIRSAVTSIFGSTADQTSAVADSAQAGAVAEENLADGITEAGKAAKKATASFDELNVLQSGTGTTDNGAAGTVGSAVTVGPMSVDAEVDETLTPKLAAIVKRIQQIFAPLKKVNLDPLKKAFADLKKAAAPLTAGMFSGLGWLYEKILVPLAAWTIEDLLPSFLNLLSNAANFLAEVLEKLRPLGEWLWTNLLQPLASWTGGAIIDVITWLSEKFGKLAEAISWLGKVWGQLKVTAVKCWENIKSVWASVSEWFNQKVTEPIGKFFKNMINGVIGAINGMISAVVKAINWVIGVLNKMSFNVPDWVPEIGGKRLGFNLTPVTAPKIPYLAQGAVLPPNKPFMAVVGDQTHGTNIEAPLETIKQALEEVLSTQRVNLGDINIKFSGSLAQLARILKPVIDVEDQRVGTPIIRRTSGGK